MAVLANQRQGFPLSFAPLFLFFIISYLLLSFLLQRNLYDIRFLYMCEILGIVRAINNVNV